MLRFIFKSETYICTQDYSHSQIKCRVKINSHWLKEELSTHSQVLILSQSGHLTSIWCLQVCN